MAEIRFIGGHIELEKVPKKPKRLTGTRFATVMGLNVWQTPFEAWCAITRTYEEPFVDNKYTIAGKVIEPKVIEYLNNTYFMDLQSAEDVYGDDYFKKTWGNFFPNEEFFGGMWDALGDNFVVEIKTTKRAEDWKDDVPMYYKLQAALYAHLLGFDDVVVTASFLEDKDYEDPHAFVPSVENTVVFEFSISEAFPNFIEDYIEPAEQFWRDHVETGISPDFDEKKDAEILEALRTNVLAPTDEQITAIIDEADTLQKKVDAAKADMKDDEKRLKELKDKVKKYMTEQYRDDDEKVAIETPNFEWVLSRSVRESIDKKKMKEDGIYEQYVTQSESHRLMTKEK